MHGVHVASGQSCLMTLVEVPPSTVVNHATLPSTCHHSCMLMQNPKERITLGKMMKHPWVTRRGSWPLRTVKEMVRVGETPELPPVLPDLMSTLNVLDIPRQVQHTPCPDKLRCYVVLFIETTAGCSMCFQATSHILLRHLQTEVPGLARACSRQPHIALRIHPLTCAAWRKTI